MSEQAQAMSEKEYRDKKTALEAQLAELEAAYQAGGAGRPAYPAWRYHDTEGARIVQSEEEANALGPGWTASPGEPANAKGAKANPAKDEAPAKAEGKPHDRLK